MFPVVDNKMSGALLVAHRFAKTAMDAGVGVRLIDYVDGLLPRLLLKENYKFEFIDLEGGGWSNRVSSEDVVFGFNNDIYTYPHVFNNNPKVYIYDVYYPFWDRFLKPKNIPLPMSDKYVKSLDEKGFFYNALSVMEEMGSIKLKARFDFISPDNINVVPVSIAVGENVFVPPAADEIKISYIGRSEFWKMAPLAKLIADLHLVQDSRRVNFCLSVVVSDVKKAKILLGDLGCNFSNLKIDFYENLSSSELERVVIRNTHIGYAMGASALEFASRGIPTLLADYSHKKIDPSYKYKWLHQAKGFTLGLDLDDHLNNSRLSEGVGISEVISDFLNDPREVSRKCFEYVGDYHLSMSNDKALLGRALGTTVRAKDMASFYTFCFILGKQ